MSHGCIDKRRSFLRTSKRLTESELKECLNRAIGGKHVGEINFGNFGTVKRVFTEDISIKQNLVCKINRRDDDYDNMCEEARIHFSMRHANIISCFGYSCIESSRKVFLLLPQAPRSLFDRLISLREDIIPLSMCRSIMGDIASGLSYIHNLNYVHRDIKPKNILLNENNRAMIADFGCTVPVGSKNPLRILSAKDNGDMVFHGVKVNRELQKGDLCSAPEAYTCENIMKVSDIFNLGFVLLCLLSSRALSVAWTNHPDCKLSNCQRSCPHRLWPERKKSSSLRSCISQTSAAEIRRLYRPMDDPHLLEQLFNLVRECMDIDLDQRIPTAEQVENRCTPSPCASSWPCNLL